VGGPDPRGAREGRGRAGPRRTRRTRRSAARPARPGRAPRRPRPRTGRPLRAGRPDGASEPAREGRPPGEARCGMARPPSRASREGILARGTGVTSRIDRPPPSFHPRRSSRPCATPVLATRPSGGSGRDRTSAETSPGLGPAPRRLRSTTLPHGRHGSGAPLPGWSPGAQPVDHDRGECGAQGPRVFTFRTAEGGRVPNPHPILTGHPAANGRALRPYEGGTALF